MKEDVCNTQEANKETGKRHPWDDEGRSQDNQIAGTESRQNYYYPEIAKEGISRISAAFFKKN
jgi:hypothetical protein